MEILRSGVHFERSNKNFVHKFKSWTHAVGQNKLLSSSSAEWAHIRSSLIDLQDGTTLYRKINSTKEKYRSVASVWVHTWEFR